ncbi:helix-turn-helix transcriptional regulator [Chryseobacterium sp. SN22]|uniref:helix-turn-helix transcriptional regulator n=1 Tax=Chryseobacterium sp. SN22 TaxID=2606431 RepID=UPI0011EC2365|nr:AraC family transcriptional regulator [Chryseobacterium sp. SN22]KAA0127150.1 helix-turn-helix transcriptional regulator [Chryseobacterium sp. SN22]
MKNQSGQGLLFSSENIKIFLKEELYTGRFSKSDIIEGRTSFNLLFFLSENIHLNAEDCGTKFLFKRNQYILHYSREESTAELWTENKEMLKYLQIQMNYDYISNLINPESNKENADILEGMIRNHYIFLHKQTPPSMTVEMQIILKEIISYSKKGILQKLFVEAKIIKLLLLIFEQFNERNTLEKMPKTPLTIKKFIDENYHRNIKAEDIGKLIGINQNKIRKEFKAHYHRTVSDYMAELRMLKAKKLITDREIMIKEIAIECGYEYVQNFTRAFKKKFGISPEKLRMESFN